jgi:hypothetical protein
MRRRFCIAWLSAAVLAAWVSLSAAEDTRVLKQLDDARAKYTTARAWKERRTALREGFLRGARLWPLPEKTPLHPIRHSRRAHDGYSVENVALETLPGFYCTGNLYRPLGRTGRRPAVLCPHGHFDGGRYRADQQIRCAHLARMGAVVFSYSMVGWQDSQQTTHDDPLVLALQTWNSIRVVDFLCDLPEVDPQRLGVTGASGGGSQTIFLTAVDDRVTAAAPVVIVYPWSWFSPACRCESGMPVMRTPETNAIELTAYAAPRPLLVVTCGLADAGKPDKDPTWDFPRTGRPFIRHVYQLLGRPERFRSVHLADEGHDYGPSKRHAMYASFGRHLGLDVLPEDREKITLERPEQMAVFSDRHALPKRAVHGSREVARAFAALRRGAVGAERLQPAGK